MKNKKIISIFILIAVIGVAVYFLYRSFLVEKPPQVSVAPLLKIKTNFALDVLNEPNFMAQKIYGKLPVVVSQKGKANPFMKF